MKVPDRFIAAVACLPVNDMEFALKGIDRAVVKLKFGRVHSEGSQAFRVGIV